MPCVLEKKGTKKTEPNGFNLAEAKQVVQQFQKACAELPDVDDPPMRRDAILKLMAREPGIRAVQAAVGSELVATRKRIETGEVCDTDYAAETQLVRFFPSCGQATALCVHLKCELGKLAVPNGLLCFCESVSEVATALGNAPTKARLRATTHKIVAKLLENLNEQAAEVSRAISSGSADELQKLAERMNLQ